LSSPRNKRSNSGGRKPAFRSWLSPWGGKLQKHLILADVTDLLLVPSFQGLRKRIKVFGGCEGALVHPRNQREVGSTKGQLPESRVISRGRCNTNRNIHWRQHLGAKLVRKPQCKENPVLLTGSGPHSVPGFVQRSRRRLEYSGVGSARCCHSQRRELISRTSRFSPRLNGQARIKS
jgi:hypothetical protein